MAVCFEAPCICSDGARHRGRKLIKIFFLFRLRQTKIALTVLILCLACSRAKKQRTVTRSVNKIVLFFDYVAAVFGSQKVVTWGGIAIEQLSSGKSAVFC